MFNSQKNSILSYQDLIILAKSDLPKARDARAELFLMHQFMLHNLVNRILPDIIAKNDCYPLESSIKEDLEQVAAMAFLEAIEKFDFKFGVKLSTYAWAFVRGRLLDYLEKEIQYFHIKAVKETNSPQIDCDDGDCEDQEIDDYSNLGIIDPRFVRVPVKSHTLTGACRTVGTRKILA